MKHPSLHAYTRGCRCPECTALNTAYIESYRSRRQANFGQPLDPRNYRLPGTLTRLWREIGIVPEYKA